MSEPEPRRPRVASDAGALLVGRVLSSLTDALVPLTLCRLLDKTSWGVLLAIITVYGTVSIVLTAGFPDAAMYFLPARPERERRAVAWQITRALAGLGLATGAVLAALPLLVHLLPSAVSSWLSSDGGALGSGNLELLWVMALYAIVDLPSKALPNILVAEGRARTAAQLGAIQAILRSASFILPVALGWPLRAVLVCVNVFGLLNLGLVGLTLHALYAGVEKIPSPVTVRQIAHFGFPVGATEIVSKINEYVDRYLIMFLFTAEVLAIYGMGSWQIPLITSIAYSVGSAYAPRFTALFREGRGAEAIALWRASIEKVALAVVPLSMVFLIAAEESMILLFGRKFLAGANVFRLYTLITMGRVAAFGTVMVSAGRPRYVLLASLVTLGANVLFSTPLVFVMGMEGPALGSVIAFVAMVLAYSVGIGRAARVPLRSVFPLRAYLRVVLVAAVAAVPAALFKLHSPFSAGVTLGGVALLCAAGFALLGSALGLVRREDWRFLLEWARRPPKRTRAHAAETEPSRAAHES